MVQGTGRLGWDQRAPNETELAQYHYVVYVDGAPQAVSDTNCQGSGDSGAFTCTGALPSMSPGTHQLELATIAETSDGPLESERSAALTVVIAARQVVRALRGDPTKALVASDGTRFVITTLATGLDSPSGLATLPDGRVFVAERSGRVRVWQTDRMLSIPALSLDDAAPGADIGLLGIAAHPDFVQNNLVFVAYTAREDDGTFTNRVVRYRELDNIFAQGVVILQDSVSQAPHRTPRIRFGPDGKLYVAFPSADRAAAQDPASYAGKILRLNEDGTTPRDNPRYSPIISDEQGVPVAFGWQPTSGKLWQIDRDWSGGDWFRWLESRSPVGYFDSGTDPSAASFYSSPAIRGFTGDLFVAALDGRHVQRVRFDPSDSAHVTASERLLDGQYGRISDIVAGPNGALYFCTSNRGTSEPQSDDDRLATIGPDLP